MSQRVLSISRREKALIIWPAPFQVSDQIDAGSVEFFFFRHWRSFFQGYERIIENCAEFLTRSRAIQSGQFKI